MASNSAAGIEFKLTALTADCQHASLGPCSLAKAGRRLGWSWPSEKVLRMRLPDLAPILLN
jgi:hypothetical protein